MSSVTSQNTEEAPDQNEQFRPTGRRKAVLIGINYVDMPSVGLSGCVRDVEYLHYLLKTKFAFAEFVLLTDEQISVQSSPNVRKGYPTHRNIMQAILQLVQGSEPGDSLFLSFSGHGMQVPDKNGDEPDGYDEALVPADFVYSGVVIDDDLAYLVQKVCKGARLTALIDACHSGSAMDLPYEYAARPHVFPVPANIGGRTLWENMGEVWMIAGCHDDEKSADDAHNTGVLPCGAVTLVFVQTIEEFLSQKITEFNFGYLLAKMRAELRRKGHVQNPVLSTSRPVDLNTLFLL